MKYQELEAKLNDGIAKGEFSASIPSARELARRYKTTRSSVERAIAELRANGVIETVPRVGHRIIRQKKRFTSVGMLWPNDSTPSSLFHETFDEIQTSLPMDYTLFTQTYGADPAAERDCLAKFLSMNIQGLFAFPVIEHDRLVNRDMYEKLARVGVKIVFLMRDVREIAASCIYYDNASLVEAMLSKLSEFGAQVFVHLSYAGHEVERIRKRYFFMRYGASTMHHWVDLAEIRRDNWRDVLSEMKEKIASLDLAANHPGMRIGFSCSNDLYVYLGWRALIDIGLRDYKLLSDGWLRSEIMDFFHVAPSEMDMNVFNYPRLSFRADDVGRLALERMRFMLDKKETIVESVPLSVRFFDDRIKENMR